MSKKQADRIDELEVKLGRALLTCKQQADELAAIKAQADDATEYVLAVENKSLRRAIKMASNALDNPIEVESDQRSIKEALVYELIAHRDELRAALELMFDKWENGDECYEDGDPQYDYLGSAFKLTDGEQDRILRLLGPVRNPTEKGT